jgi:predicted transglutaminase-like cysteine proteinase
MPRFPMPCKLALGLRLCLCVASIIGSLLDVWPAIALHLSELSPSQFVAPRFPELSPAQIVALRFPEVSAFRALAAHSTTTATASGSLPEISVLGASAAHSTTTATVSGSLPGLSALGASEAHSTTTATASGSLPEISVLGASAAHSTTTATASGSPSPLVHLIDFQVAPTLPPIGLSRFCLRYPDDCKVHTIDFRHRNIALTTERWYELNGVNHIVNRSITELMPGNGTTEQWAIAPRFGDCTDYAITKRHDLLARGWPSRALLLSEVALPSGEHHLLLVVRMKNTDLVLDNINDEVRPAAMTYNQYVWVRIQSPQNPKFWMRVL